MRLIRHPLVARDVAEVARHVLTVSGDKAAALRRLDEIDALLASILDAPDLGSHLDGPLEGWRVRHGGRGRALSIIYRAEGDRLLVAMVAFAGQDWTTSVLDRSGFEGASRGI